MQTSEKINLLDYTSEDLKAFFLERGEKPFRATQIIKWIHQHGVDNFDDMTNVSKALREEMASYAEIEKVVKAMELMLDDNAYGLSKRRVTLSTSGVVPALDRLKDRIEVSLAISLHAPNNALRDKLVPVNKKYPTTEFIVSGIFWKMQG